MCGLDNLTFSQKICQHRSLTHILEVRTPIAKAIWGKMMTNVFIHNCRLFIAGCFFPPMVSVDALLGYEISCEHLDLTLQSRVDKPSWLVEALVLPASSQRNENMAEFNCYYSLSSGQSHHHNSILKHKKSSPKKTRNKKYRNSQDFTHLSIALPINPSIFSFSDR